MNITNKTRRPIRVPLPEGKKLFLGPGKTGQITSKSAQHPPLVELLNSGDLELDETGQQQSGATPGGPASPSTGQSGGAPSSNIRRTGDR